MEHIITVAGFLVTILVAFITAFLTSKNNEKKTTSEYFKKEGIKIQKRLLEFWSGILVFDFDKHIDNYKESAELDENLNAAEVSKIVQKESILYSSKATIKAIATYQQYNYKIINKVDNNKNKIKWLTKIHTTIKNIQAIVVALRVTKRMKYDFTGEKLSPVDLMKMRLNDMDRFKSFLARYFLVYYFLKENFWKILFTIILIIIAIIILLCMI